MFTLCYYVDVCFDENKFVACATYVFVTRWFIIEALVRRL